MLKDHKLILVFLSLVYVEVYALKLDRVILASNSNPNYLEFWPVVAKTWKRVIGVQPTLALIDDTGIIIDESLGDVIRVPSIEGVPTWFQAQVVRLFLPILFPEDVCILSDMDLVPLNRRFFTDGIEDLPENSFLVYNNNANQDRFPICYLAAKGRVFAEVFNAQGVKSVDDVNQLIKYWFETFLPFFGWDTDERVFHRYITQWDGYAQRCCLLNRFDGQRRIDRSSKMNFDLNKLRSSYYYDMHLPRPYFKCRDMIDDILNHLGADRLSNN